MARQSLVVNTLGLTILALLLAAAHIAAAQSVTAVPKLNNNDLRGAWYEIARYPNKYEKHCVGDAVELITRGEKLHHLQLVDSCKSSKGFTDIRNINANPQDKLGDGEFKIITLWPFSRKYWVLALAPDKSWLLIGSPNHKYLWIYAKAVTLQPQALAQIEDKATAEGFPASRLVFPPQKIK